MVQPSRRQTFGVNRAGVRNFTRVCLVETNNKVQAILVKNNCFAPTWSLDSKMKAKERKAARALDYSIPIAQACLLTAWASGLHRYLHRTAGSAAPSGVRVIIATLKLYT